MTEITSRVLGTHRKNDSESCWIRSNFDCNYIFSNDFIIVIIIQICYRSTRFNKKFYCVQVASQRAIRIPRPAISIYFFLSIYFFELLFRSNTLFQSIFSNCYIDIFRSFDLFFQTVISIFFVLSIYFFKLLF